MGRYRIVAGVRGKTWPLVVDGNERLATYRGGVAYGNWPVRLMQVGDLVESGEETDRTTPVVVTGNAMELAELIPILSITKLED